MFIKTCPMSVSMMYLALLSEIRFSCFYMSHFGVKCQISTLNNVNSEQFIYSVGFYVKLAKKEQSVFLLSRATWDMTFLYHFVQVSPALSCL